MREHEIKVLVDVRLNAISRRRGFSKTALAAGLAVADIDYLHLRALGNPKSNRAGFSGTSRQLARSKFRQILAEPAARQALLTLNDLRRGRAVAVLCFEEDELACHRDVIIEELDRLVHLAS